MYYSYFILNSMIFANICTVIFISFLFLFCWILFYEQIIVNGCVFPSVDCSVRQLYHNFMLSSYKMLYWYIIIFFMR